MAENYYYSTLSGDEIESRLVGGVVFNQDQTLTTSEKARARQNIGAGESDSTFKVLGYFASYEDMIQSLQQIPAPGDAYGIGTASPYDVYVYDGVHDTWVNNGPIVLSDAVIDDEDIATDTTWSSSKINTEIGAVRTLANTAQSAADAAQLTADAAETSLLSKQDTLVSGQNIKTVNGQSLLGGGDVTFLPPVVDTVSLASNLTVSANTATSEMTTPIPEMSGYSPVGVVGWAIWGSSYQNLVPIRLYVNSGSVVWRVRNVSNSSATLYMSANILYVPN